MKVVAESLKAYKEANLDEGLRDLVSKGIELIKGMFRKIGKFFIAMSPDGKPVKAVLPANIAIMYRDNMLSKSIIVVPNKRDIELDPTLAAVRTKAMQQINSRKGLANEAEVAKYMDSLNEGFKKGDTELSTSSTAFLKHPNPKVRNINSLRLAKHVLLAIRNPLSAPLMIWGAPGIGKTEIVNSVLEQTTGGRLIDVQTSTMMRDDWMLPAIYRDEKGELKAGDIPKVVLPVYKLTGNAVKDAEGNDIANDGEGGVIFLDELSRADHPVLATCLKLMGKERTIGGQFKLGSKWTVIAAGNRAGDDTGELNFSKALGNRVYQYNYVPDFLSWKKWAIQAKVNDDILTFLEFNQQYFYESNAEDFEDYLSATPRTWYQASTKIQEFIEEAQERGESPTSEDIFDAVAGAVGVPVAVEFETFMTLMNSYSKEQIEEIYTHPEKAKLPTKKGSGYDLAEAGALLAVLCSYSKKWGKDLPSDKYENYIDFLIRLDDGTIAVMGLMLMTQYHPYIKLEVGDYPGKDKYQKAVDKFIKHYGSIWQESL